MRSISVFGSAAAAAMNFIISQGSPVIGYPDLSIVELPKPTQRGVKARNKTTMFKPNGKQEVARRLRQVAAGRLTVSNGLKEHGNE